MEEYYAKNNKSVSGIMIFCVLLCGFIVLGVLAGCYYYLSSQQEQTEGTSSLSEDLSSTSSSEGTLLVARSGNATMDAYYAQALAALENMSIEEKIGQMLCTLR